MYQIQISVRGLVEFIFRTGDIASGDGSFSKNAMLEGSRIHRKIQGKMGPTIKNSMWTIHNIIKH